jgi:hypothetical protein
MAKTQYEKNAAYKAGKRHISKIDVPAKSLKKRKELRHDLPAWLRYFFPQAFTKPFSPDHLSALQKIYDAATTGGLFSLAMPRSFGKTTAGEGALTWMLLEGFRKYVVAIASKSDEAKKFIEFFSIALETNPRIREHYPQLAEYITHIEGKAEKCRFALNHDGTKPFMVYSKSKMVLPMPPDAGNYPWSGGVIEVAGTDGAIRGKQQILSDGSILRPDFVFLDDPQTRESAHSEMQTRSREDLIKGDVLGLGGDRKVSGVMLCTVIAKGDLADRFLDHSLHPTWRGEKTAIIRTWPDAQDTLWKEYQDIYKSEVLENGNFDRATEFYKANRDAMDAGASVAWEEKYSEEDGEISALQHAQNRLIEEGDQFWAERMNQPKTGAISLYELKDYHVYRNVNKNYAEKQIPKDHIITTVFTDVNHYALTTVVCTFAPGMTNHVAYYFQYPERGVLVEKDATEQEKSRRIYEGLDNVGRMLQDLGLEKDGKREQISLWLVDAGYATKTVYKFCSTFKGVPVMASRGFNANYYRPPRDDKTMVMEQCHFATGKGGTFIAHNACFWREVAQRAWLSPVGSLGSASLYRRRLNHRDFATEICGETLIDKAMGNKGFMWKWKTTGKHDYLDSFVGCYVAAAWRGLSTSEQNAPAKRKKKKRKKVSYISM